MTPSDGEVHPRRFNLIDHHFVGDASAVRGVTPELLAWHRGRPIHSLPTVVTHEDMYRTDVSAMNSAPLYGLLVESQAIIPRVYRRVTRAMDRYDLVFTHSSRLLANHPNARWIPGGGVWIGGTFGGGVAAVHAKSRDVSMLSSGKVQCRLHRRRYNIAAALDGRHSNVDVFRQRVGASWPTFEAYQTLRDYRYSICIENYQDEAYFTEKILNCFATGTVPIYLGARSIGRYFDDAGIIQFSTYRQLVREILPMVGESDYASRLAAVEENYSRVWRYHSIEDFIMKEYLA